MKRAERKKIKTNEFAMSVARAQAALAEHQRQVTALAIVVVAIALAAGGYFTWRTSRNSKATTMLATALATAEAQVVPLATPAPGSPPPIQQPGTYPTETARAEAALPLLLQTANAYPSTPAGVTARYRAAATLASLGRFAEADAQYQQVIQKTGHDSIYGRTARLGLGEAQLAEGKTDASITTLQELATDTTSDLPLDGVLMQLGRAYLKAGKTAEASRAFTRVIDEFPQSLFAEDARAELATVKKG
jgi:TolA-binding protein